MAARSVRTGSRSSTKPRRSNSTSTVRGRDRRTSYDSVREVQGKQIFLPGSSAQTDITRADVPQSFKRRGRDTQVDESAIESYPPSPVVTPMNNSLRTTLKLQQRRRTQSQDSVRSFALEDHITSPTLPTPVSSIQRQSAPIERLPTELLEDILWRVTGPNPHNEYASPYADLISCLRVSRAMYVVGLQVLYQNVSIPHSIKFSNVMKNFERDNGLAALVRRVDFSRYSNIGFGRTKQASSQILNVTPKTLKRCLELTTNLQEFLVHEHIDDELSIEVLEHVFSRPHIEALDFCACSSTSFTEQLSSFVARPSPSISPSLKRLSLHECTTFQAPFFEKLMPLLPSLTHLDVAHTLITDKALLSIPKTARITHLNLGRCTRITGGAVVEFLTQHPAVKNSLVYLNLMAEPGRHRLLSDTDLSALLPRLPSTVRSLNIGGARTKSVHLPMLQRLAEQVEELGLANADLTSEEIESLCISQDDKIPFTSSIRYLDLTDVSSVSQFSLQFPKSPKHKPLASRASKPLEVIELSDSVLEPLRKSTQPRRGAPTPDWTVRELGRRGWLVRVPEGGSGEVVDDGSRSWKMGARWWGMRKVSVAQMEVSGMYGFYAFKRI